MKIDLMNFLIVELLTIGFSMFLFYKKIFPLVMIMILIVHIHRLEKYYKHVNKKFQPNFQIFVLYIILMCGLFYFKKFVLFGLLFGLLQHGTYILHEKQNTHLYKWGAFEITIPMIFISSFMAQHGYENKILLLSPFLGDAIHQFLKIFIH